MANKPVWITPPGDLGTIPEGRFYQLTLRGYNEDQPDNRDAIFYTLIAGRLPPGIQCRRNGLIEGTPQSISSVQGVPSEVAENITHKFAVRIFTENSQGQVERVADRTFTLTIAGQDFPEWITPAGSLGSVYDGAPAEIQLEYQDTDPGQILETNVISGRLPPGLTLSKTGLISGVVVPAIDVELDSVGGFDVTDSAFDEFPWDFTTRGSNKNYQFAVEIYDGKTSTIRNFEIFVYSKNRLTSDSIEMFADDTYITSDVDNRRTPFLTQTQEDLGTVRHDNFFAYKFQGVDYDNDPIEYGLVIGAFQGFDARGSVFDQSDIGFDRGDLRLPPGLRIDSTTGWMYGYIPDQGITDQTYKFAVQLNKKFDPDIVSPLYFFTLRIIGDLETEIQWEVPDNLGSIDNGDLSYLFVAAATLNRNRKLSYRLKQGSRSKLPQGLRLLSSGNIVGRSSFQTFQIDGASTTFDSEFSTRLESKPTTFDRTYRFTVEAYAAAGSSRSFQVDKISLTPLIEWTPSGTVQAGQTLTYINRRYRVESVVNGLSQGTLASTGPLHTSGVALNGNVYLEYQGQGSSGGTGYDINSSYAVIIQGGGSSSTSNIETITLGQPTIVSTYTNHLLKNSDSIRITGVTGVTDSDGQSLINSKTFYVLVVNEKTLRLFLDSGLTIPVDSRSYSAYQFGGVLQGGAGTGAGAAASASVESIIDPDSGAVIDTVISAVSVTNGGTGYTSAPTIKIGQDWEPNKPVTIGENYSWLDKHYVITQSGVTGNFPPTHDSSTAANGTAEFEFRGYRATAFGILKPESNSFPISTFKEFEITVNNRYSVPYETLYIEAMPPNRKITEYSQNNDRRVLESLLNNNDIFPKDLIYRSDDENFGVAKKIIYPHAYGLKPSVLEQYIDALEENHYRKQLILDNFKSARAVDPETGRIIYEVIYSEIVDDQTNQGVSVSDQVLVNRANRLQQQYLSTNSLDNMRARMFSLLSQVAPGLPLWMRSVQEDGTVPNFVPCWTVAYLKPGTSEQILYYLREYFNAKLNTIDFTADRYVIDKSMTVNWNVVDEEWNKGQQVTFDRFNRSGKFNFLGDVDYATTLAFSDIHNRSLAYIQSQGGIDGVSSYQELVGKKIIFQRQEGFVIDEEEAWSRNDDIYEDTGFESLGFNGSTLIPGELQIRQGLAVVNQRLGIWEITIDPRDNIVKLELQTPPSDPDLYETQGLDLIRVRRGRTVRNNYLYIPQSPAQGLRYINWQFAPFSIIPETQFDGGSCRFISNMDKTTRDTNDNKYLMYPKHTILGNKDYIVNGQ